MSEFSASCDTEPHYLVGDQSSVVNCFRVHVQSLSVGLGCGALMLFAESDRNDP